MPPSAGDANRGIGGGADANPGTGVPGRSRLPIFAAAAQGFFCLVIGLWPVVSLASFLSVTGQKPDHWLLSLAGLLLAGIGLSMLISAIRRDVAFEVFAIGLTTALSLAATDIIFVIERSIPAVYLLDAVAESLFVTLWVFAIRSTRRGADPTRRGADPTRGVATPTRGVADPARSAREPAAAPAPPIAANTTEPRGMDGPK